MKLSAVQDLLHRRIKRCPATGYRLTKQEERSAKILEAAGLIIINYLRIAFPAEEGK